MDFRELKTNLVVGIILTIISGISLLVNNWVGSVNTNLENVNSNIAIIKTEVDYMSRSGVWNHPDDSNITRN